MERRSKIQSNHAVVKLSKLGGHAALVPEGKSVTAAHCMDFLTVKRPRCTRAKLKAITSTTLRATAYHEAGHAVAAIAFDYLAESDLLTIVAQGDVLGSVSYGPPLMQGCQNRRQLRKLVEQMCVGTYSGLPAERLFDPCAPDFHGEGDEIQALNLPRDHGIAPRGCQFIGDNVYDRYLERLKRKAEEFVEKQKPAIRTLVKTLLERKTITGADAMRIVRPLLR